MTTTTTRPNAGGITTPQPADRLAGVGRAFRPDVEGLRAIAVGVVVVYHLRAAWLPGGFVGVDIFFVLSGFLITSLLVREAQRTGRVSIADFYARRARRILPAATLVAAATVIAAARVLDPTRARDVTDDARWAAGFMANVRFLHIGTDYLHANTPPSPLQHYWSLSVEEQFYLVWPLLLLAVTLVCRQRRGALVPVAATAMTVLSVGSLIWCVTQTASDPTSAYFSPFTRAWELGLGALVAIAQPGLRRFGRAWLGSLTSWVGLGLIVFAVVAYDDNTPFPGIAALAPVGGAALMVAGGTMVTGRGPERFLKLWPFQFIGALSYSIYLWHYPVIILARGSNYHTLGPVADCVVITLSVGLAYATYRLVEQPIRRAKTLIRLPSASLAMGVSLLAVSAVVAGYLGSGYMVQQDIAVASSAQQPVGASTSLAAADILQQAVNADGQGGHLTAAEMSRLPAVSEDSEHQGSCPHGVSNLAQLTSRCAFGDTSSKHTIVLYGDSHAGMWLPAMEQIASANHLRLILIELPGCPLPSLNLLSEVTGRPNPACTRFHDWVPAQIDALHPRLVVATDSFYTPHLANGTIISTSLWRKGLTTTLRGLAGPQRKVTMLGDIPYLAQSAPECLQLKKDIGSCATSAAKAILATHDTAERYAAVAAGATYINVTPWMCGSECMPVINGTFVYRNQFHITATFSAHAEPALAQALNLDPLAPAALVLAAQNVTKLPSDLSPSLNAIASDGGEGRKCMLQATAIKPRGCTFGDVKAKRTIVVFGDSHAAQWIPAFDVVGKHYNWRVLEYAKANCPPIQASVWNSQLKRSYDECDKWRGSVVTDIQDIKPSVLVLAGNENLAFTGADGKPDNKNVPLRYGLAAGNLIKQVRAETGRIIVLGDTPIPTQDPASCLATNSNPQNCSVTYRKAYPANEGKLLESGMRNSGGRYYDTSHYLCSPVRCFFVVGAMVTEFDPGQLTGTFSTYLAPYLALNLGLAGVPS